MKKLFVVGFVFFFSFLVFAEEGFSLAVEPCISYNNNTITYKIYDPSGPINSQLDWESQYLIKAGVGALAVFNKVTLDGLLLFDIPSKTGVMFDSDWYTVGLKTNLSKSELFAGFGCDFKLEFKYDFSLPADFFVSPVVSLQNYYSTFNAKNTIGWCGDTAHTQLDQDYAWDSEYSKKVKKYGIDYYYENVIFLSGVQLQKRWGDFSLKIKALVSLYDYVLSVDHHLNKKEGTYYQLIQKSILNVQEYSVSGAWSINEKHSFNLSFSYSFCPERPADFYLGYYKTDNIIADETAGLEFSRMSVNVGWQIKIK